LHVGVIRGEKAFDLKGKKFYRILGSRIYKLSGEMVGHLAEQPIAALSTYARDTVLVRAISGTDQDAKLVPITPSTR
jgi:hypothetical protein